MSRTSRDKKLAIASAEQLKKMKSYDYECFERHQHYMEKKGYADCIPEWWAMYEGRQTPANYDSDLPRATENITAWVIDSQHATILGTTVTLNFTCFDKNLSTDGLKKFDEYVQKAIGMEEKKDDIVLDAEVASAGLLYHYWSDDILTFKGNNKGSLGLDVIALEDFFCSNPRLRDIQRQKYEGFRHRAEVKAVRATVSKSMKNYNEIIASIVPDDYLEEKTKYDSDDLDFETGAVTLYTRFFRIDGEVYWTRSTKYVQLCEPIPLNPDITVKKLRLKKEYEENGYAPDDEEIYELDPEVPNFQDEKMEKASEESHVAEKDKMMLYPISILVLRRRRNCLYGRSVVEDVYDNQKLVNFMVAMVAKEIQDTAWATIIMKEGAANGQTWTGQPGGVFTDYTPGNNFGIKRLEGNQLNAQVMNYVSTIIDITKMITGTNELVDSSSNLKDVTAYALQILEEQRNKKIEALQNRYWRFLVECAKIRLQFYKHYYPESYYVYDLTDAEYQDEVQSYEQLLAKPNEAFNPQMAKELGLREGITNKEVAEEKGEPTKTQRKKLDPKEVLLGHYFDIICEPGKGTKYSEIIDTDLINNLFLNGGYEKMSPDSFEMWLNLNPLMSESKKADIRVLITKQRQSENAQLKGQLQEMTGMLQMALSRVKQLEILVQQKDASAASMEKSFKDSLGAAKEMVANRDEIIKQLQGQKGGSGLPSAEEMAKND